MGPTGQDGSKTGRTKMSFFEFFLPTPVLDPSVLTGHESNELGRVMTTDLTGRICPTRVIL
jgi:hypothetical protein